MRNELLVPISCLLAVMLLLTLFPGCGSSKTTRAEGEPEYAPAIVDNLMSAFNEGKYAAFSKNFDTTMKQAVSESVFTEMHNTMKEKIGDYVSRKFISTGKEGVYTIVLYNAKFSKEPADVTVRFVFLESEESVLISGLLFDSPKLREQ